MNENTITDIQGRVFDRRERDYVMQRLNYNGTDYIGPRESGDDDDLFVQCWLAADGFGEISYAQACESCWDWSHVRDSSPEAIHRIAQMLGYDPEVSQ